MKPVFYIPDPIDPTATLAYDERKRLIGVLKWVDDTNAPPVCETCLKTEIRRSQKNSIPEALKVMERKAVRPLIISGMKERGI